MAKIQNLIRKITNFSSVDIASNAPFINEQFKSDVKYKQWKILPDVLGSVNKSLNNPFGKRMKIPTDGKIVMPA